MARVYSHIMRMQISIKIGTIKRSNKSNPSQSNGVNTTATRACSMYVEAERSCNELDQMTYGVQG